MDRMPSRGLNGSRSPGVVRRSLMIGPLVIGLGLTIGHGALGQATATPSPSGPPASTNGPGAAGVPLSPLVDEALGFRAVVPSGWTDQGGGIYTRASATTDAGDHTLVTLQSAQFPPAALWPSLEPQLALTSPPQPVGTRETAVLQWTLYHVDVAAPTSPTVVDVAMAQADGRTWIVTLWSAPDESDSLREQVFLPILDAFAPLPTPTPSANAAYESVGVTFPGGAPEVTLSGTLTLPRGEGPHPGIVLLTGSGPQDRDESLAPVAAIKPFALIADALSGAGIAVLRFDDRGVAQSSGDYLSASVADLTRDGEAAVRYLRSRPEIDPARVGVLGHSEGGIEVASMGAADPSLAFVVAMAGPSVPGVDLLVAQAEAVARASGQTEARVAALGQQQRAILEAVRDGQEDTVHQLLAKAIGEAWDRMTADQQQAAGPRDTYVQQLTRGPGRSTPES